MKEGIFKLIKEILFPCFCVDCGQEGEWLCQQCLANSKVDHIKQCPVCCQLTLAGEVCKGCKATSYLDGVTAFFKYTEGSSLAKLIKQFKYSYARDISNVWQAILSRQSDFLTVSLRIADTAVIPVPLHTRRERERGFNQAEIIARIIRQILGLSDMTIQKDNGLVRCRNTKQQAKLSGEQRRRNLAGAFAWQSQSDAPKEVLLVDDVFTTGSTLQECAKALKANGSGRVWGLVLARG